MTAQSTPRRWFRVWFKYPEDYRSEDTLLVHATDEHAVFKMLANEGKRVTACYTQHPDFIPTPTEET